MYYTKDKKLITSPETSLMNSLFPQSNSVNYKAEVGNVVNTCYMYNKIGDLLILTRDVLVVGEELRNGISIPALNHVYSHNTFDTETHKLTENFAIPDNLQFLGKFGTARESAQAIIYFAINVFISNKYVYDYLLEHPLDFTKNKEFLYLKNTNKLYYLFVKNSSLAENIIKTNPKVLLESFDSVDVKSDVKSLKSSVGLPSVVLEFLAEKKCNFLIPYIQTLSDDGNDSVIIMDFLKSTKTFTKRKREVSDFFKDVLRNLAEIKTLNNSYKVVDMLRYVLSQTMNHGNWTMDGLKQICSLFKDYVHIKIDAGLESEDNFPSDIREAHDLLRRNTKTINPKDEELFSSAVSEYKKLESTFEIKVGKEKVSFSVIAPSSQKDLVIEGSKLHHCVGTYSKRIINKSTKILFLRKTDELEKPLVTIEVDSNNNVIQAKKSFNDDVDGELEQAVKAYERKIASVK